MEVPEKERLEKEVLKLKGELAASSTEYQKLLEGLNVQKSEVQATVDELRSKKSSLEESLADLVSVRTPGLDAEVDSVLLTSGRKIICNVISYRDQRFSLEDGNGNQIKIAPQVVAGITFGEETQAEIFPDHVINRVAARPRTLPVPTPSAKKEFALKEHMVFTRIIRKKSSESIDQYIGYIDEVAEEIQYTCRVESRALPDDAKDVRMRIWVLAEDTNNENSLKLIIADSKRFDLPRIGEVEFDTKEVHLKFDDKGAKYGHKLYGWVFTLEDSKGNVVHLKRSKKKLADHLDQIRNMSLNEEIEL